jgi:Fe-S-cluster containining protein
MKDGPVRRTVKRLSLWNFQLSLWLHRRKLRREGQEHYLLGGDCRKCAKCCEAPEIQVGTLTWHLPLFRRLFLAWQHHVNGFHLTGVDDEAQAFVFRCSHFDWTTRTCDSYDSRPGVCRDYPRNLLEQPRPEFLEGCGYRAVWRKSVSLASALEAAGVSKETMERLREQLYIETPPGDPKGDPPRTP